MQIEARLKRGWGYGLIIEDNQGKKLGEMLFSKELVGETANIMRGSIVDGRRRVLCNLTIDDNGIRIDVMPKVENSTGDELTSSANELKDAFVKVTKIGRPKGAKNKPKIHISKIDSKKQFEVMNEQDKMHVHPVYGQVSEPVG